MRSLIEFLLAVVITIVVILVIGLFLPGHGHVERSIIIERPARHVFDVLNSYKRFNEWSPWHKKDSAASYNFSGPELGQGARMEWSGNELVGSGSWEILESTPTSLVKMVHRHQQGRTGTVTFDIGTSDLGVKVTWRYDVELGGNPVERLRGRYLDSSIGADYHYGLMRLKAMLESSAYPRDYSDIVIQQRELTAGPALKLQGMVEVYSATDFPELAVGVEDTMKKLNAFVERNRLNVTGQPQIRVTLKERYRLGYNVTLPVDRNDVPMRDDIEAVESLGGQVLVAEHVGERRRSNVTFEKLQAYATVHGLEFDTAAKSAVEEFLPDREAPKAPVDATAATADADAGDAAQADPTVVADAAAAVDGTNEPVMVNVTRVYLPLGLPPVADATGEAPEAGDGATAPPAAGTP
jgi:effector-binding domain-containing protein